MNVVTINTYAGSMLLGATAAKANVLATMEDCGFGSDLQALNFSKVPRYEKTEDWPEKFPGAAWRDIDIIAHPPCASFSVMAARYDFQRGTDSDGFECHARVINYGLGHRCRSVIIESVVGAYEGGREEYEKLASRYGYRVNYIFLNAVSFGVPQWRPRVWVVFHRLKTFKVNLVPRYTLLKEVLGAGPTPVEGMLGGHMGKLWEGTRKVLKGKKPVGHIHQVLRREYGLTSYEELEARFPHAHGYVSGHIRFVDPNWFSTAILGNTALAYQDRLLTLEEFCAIMGFPREYKFGRRIRQARMYLSKGVCPQVATWILKTVDKNLQGWTGPSTHETGDQGGVIDLRVKRGEIVAALSGEVVPIRQVRGTQPAIPKAARVSSSPGGHRYALVNESRVHAPGSPQATFILAMLKKAGRHGLNRHEVVAAAVKNAKGFPTNQPHDRAVGFWLSKLKSQGALEFAE